MLPFFRQHGKVFIQKDGIYPYYFDEDEEDWVPIMEDGECIGTDDFLPIYFDDFCDIDENVTMKDLMGIVLKFEEELFAPFAAYMGSIELKKFYESMNTPVSKGKEKLDNVAFSWIAGFMSDHFESCAMLDGAFIDKDSNVQKMMLDFVEPNQYADAKIIMMEQLEISDIEYDEDDGRPTIMDIYRTGVKHFTLYDVLFAFLRQITCMGDVEDQKSIIAELDKRTDAYETGNVNKIEDKSEKIEILNDKMQNALKEENYKLASKYQKEISMIQNGGSNGNHGSISESKKQTPGEDAKQPKKKGKKKKN